MSLNQYLRAAGCYLAVCGALICFITTLAGCHQSNTKVIRLGVTTSTRDSGLLDQILPEFEKRHSVQINIIAAGTGAVLKLAQQGEVDAIIVHSEIDELQFVNNGYSNRREPIMVNSFVVLGPADDPANISGLNVTDAFKKLSQQHGHFVSRGDSSGTHKRELSILEAAQCKPGWKNYLESGQGMGATLIIADQKKSYTFCDRGTFLKFREKIELIPLISDGKLLKNPYSALVVRSSSKTRDEMSNRLLDYLISSETQIKIKQYQIDGQPLFFPLRLNENKVKR